MDIILKQDMANLGFKNDVVTVKDGYARNYLIPQGFAVNATKSAKKEMEELIKQRAHKEEKIQQEAEELAEKLKEVKLTIGAKTSSKGKIFGSVNTIQISEALSKAGFDIDRKKIVIKENLIKEVGSYEATIKLHKNVQVEVPFDIVAE
ncbi:MAG: 50S ribosomal protein L9 [Bacteroidetes bacterium]|jgi:large subunit ribosomal protein L9|nr:50S ribosomal protein L9 [Bacteroidota bacterium]